jgi:tRNA-uridine 2-sulfurtransferase
VTDRPKVAVAMSGGVDSSVAAAMLVEQGYNVIGLMLRLWVDRACGEENRCCPPEAVAQARQVASAQAIPFYVLDAQSVFRRQVVDYTVEEYAAGRTPNPCIVCNRRVRWTYLLAEARGMGAEYLATGHYARIGMTDGCYQLLRGQDPRKDQSYMLSALGQAELAATIFPLGGMTKPEVREKANRLGLSVADKPDSQDLCFIPDGNTRRFLETQIPNSFTAGPIQNRFGEILGRHNGLPGYTIGQRKGIHIAADKPYYVLGVDVAANALIVGHADELGRKVLIGDNPHWIRGEAPAFPLQASIRIRYSAREEEALIHPLPDGRMRIEFLRPLRDISPGQAAVIYQEEECLGMTFIQEALE